MHYAVLLLTALILSGLRAEMLCGVTPLTPCCCSAPAPETARTCCAPVEAAPSDCQCGIAAAEASAEALPFSAGTPPRPHRSLLFLLIAPISLFRTSETVFPLFPNFGNGPPRLRCAALQQWRC